MKIVFIPNKIYSFLAHKYSSISHVPTSTISWNMSDTSPKFCVDLKPCHNSGTCTRDINNPDGYLCICQTGYTGIRCDEDIRICNWKTCFNNGNN